MGYAKEAMNEPHGTDVFTEDQQTTVHNENDTTDKILREIRNELRKARATHAPMNSHHEGYAVILEELDELWLWCKTNTHARGATPEQNRKTREIKQVAMRKEAVQIAAMAVRFIEDICSLKGE